MKSIYAAADLIEAQLLKDMLKESAIATEIFNQNARGGTGEIPFTHAYPELWLLDENDENRARDLIREYENSPTPSGVTFAANAKKKTRVTSRVVGNAEACWANKYVGRSYYVAVRLSTGTNSHALIFHDLSFCFSTVKTAR